jgi:glyoxylase-like metal-dependent hydrolase (beta-lactamase superfamily II)
MEVAQIRPGVWRWTAPHPAWRPDKLWPRQVGCVYAETRGAVILIDPLVPAEGTEAFWRALDRDRQRVAHLPVRILLTCEWHRRSADEVAERYDGDVWQPGEALADGVEVAVFDDPETRWREAVFAFPDRAVVVFGDVVEGDGEGGLQMPPNWWPPHEERTRRIRNELRRVLAWPVDVVLVSHGEPVLDDSRLVLRRLLAD